MSFWVVDPKTKEESVSLTLVMISVALLIVSMVLEMTNLVKNTSMTFEFFGASCSLYLGRSWVSSKGQRIDKE